MQKVKAHVLQDGHVDHITGPRCMIKPTEGKHKGLYLIAHTSEVFKEGQPVVYDYFTRRAVLDDSPPPVSKMVGIEISQAEVKALLYGVPKYEFSVALTRLAAWLAERDDTAPIPPPKDPSVGWNEGIEAAAKVADNRSREVANEAKALRAIKDYTGSKQLDLESTACAELAASIRALATKEASDV